MLILNHLIKYPQLSRPISSRRRKNNDIVIPEPSRIGESWNERTDISKSYLQHFEPKVPYLNPDFMTKMATPIDFSPKTIGKWFKRRADAYEEDDQKFIEQRYDILGPDLSAAHFVVHRNGAVKFANESEWIRKSADGKVALPDSYIQGLFVEAIDLKGMNLRRSGLENILDLTRLRWLSLQGNKLVDDWTVDSISGSYGQVLQYLNLSHCPRISHRALACMYRFDKLDTLVVEGISSEAEFKLSCMMLEDLKPTLTIKGIDYTAPESVPSNVT